LARVTTLFYLQETKISGNKKDCISNPFLY
jgi:hypothetical protein